MLEWDSVKVWNKASKVFDDLLADLVKRKHVTLGKAFERKDHTRVKKIISEVINEVIEVYDIDKDILKDEIRYIKANVFPEDLKEEEWFDEYKEKIYKYRKGL